MKNTNFKTMAGVFYLNEEETYKMDQITDEMVLKVRKKYKMITPKILCTLDARQV